MSETPTNPEVRIPSTEGIVAKAGIQPYPKWADPDGTGVPLWNRKDVRNGVAGFVFRIVGLFFPTSPWALFLAHYESDIQMVIDRGAK